MCGLSCVWLFVTPWTVACQAPLSMGFFRQELEWVAFSFSRGSSQPRDQTQASCTSCTGRQILYHCAAWEATKGISAEDSLGYHIYWRKHVNKCSWGSRWSLLSAATTFTWSLFFPLWNAAQAGAVFQRDSRGPTCPSAICQLGWFPHVGVDAQESGLCRMWMRDFRAHSGPHKITSFLMGSYKDFTAKLVFIPFRETAQTMYHFFWVIFITVLWNQISRKLWFIELNI